MAVRGQSNKSPIIYCSQKNSPGVASRKEDSSKAYQNNKIAGILEAAPRFESTTASLFNNGTLDAQNTRSISELNETQSLDDNTGMQMDETLR